MQRGSQFARQQASGTGAGACPRIRDGMGARLGWVMWLLMVAMAAAVSAASQTAGPVVLDRVVAVVNRHAILSSDIENEIRLSVIDPNQIGQGTLTPQRALEELISRALVEQQIREQDEQEAMPTPAEVEARVAQLRSQLPACVHQNCASEAGWQAFLAEHGLTPGRVQAYVRYRMEILRFIELRFRAGIRISQPEIEAYYRDTLLPQYRPGEAVPTLEQVAPRIEEILLEQQVNVLFDQWLTSLRKQGDVEILDPALRSAEQEPPAGNPTTAAPQSTESGSSD
jgi:peptidyl-prolyl cis-trans isomerase SurA